MNISSLLGILMALGVLFGALTSSTDSLKIFLNPHGILIVIGGTAAASLMCFPLSNYFRICGVFVKKFLGKYSIEHARVIEEIVALAKGLRDSPDFLKANVATIKNPFLKDAVLLITQGGIKDEAIDIILQKRALTHYKRYEDDAELFKVIAKFPPAFGLLGTTLGMITLMQQLGGPDAYKMLGPSMAIGLVATFYGLTLSNLILIPIGENLSKLNKEDETVRDIILDGIRLLRSREHPIVVEEYLKSYLLPNERASIRKAKA